MQTRTEPVPETSARAAGVPRRRGVRRALLWVVGALVVAGLLVAVELGSPRSIDQTGVDDLEVPWADPEPARFVAEVDHPWLPLAPGERWEYAGLLDGVRTTRTVTVLPTTREVAGIAATVVREETVAGRGEPQVRERWYAQDVRGHLWLLGESGVWSVDEGAPAGLAMAARPRRGDAHLRAPVEGAAREVVEVGEYADDGRDRLWTTVRHGGGTAEGTAEGTGEGTGEVHAVLLERGVGVVEVRTPSGVLSLVDSTLDG